MSEEFNKRINYLTDVKRYSQKVICSRLGISTKSLYNYLKDIRGPRIDLMDKLKDKFKEDFMDVNISEERSPMRQDSIFEKAQKVLDSKTEYSAALILIIDSLHTAVGERLQLLEKKEEEPIREEATLRRK